MTYTFKIDGPWPRGVEARRLFRWQLEAHFVKFRKSHEIGIGWRWSQRDAWLPPRVHCFTAASEIARYARRAIPGVRLYSLGERFVVVPKAREEGTFTLEIR